METFDNTGPFSLTWLSRIYLKDEFQSVLDEYMKVIGDPEAVETFLAERLAISNDRITVRVLACNPTIIIDTPNGTVWLPNFGLDKSFGHGAKTKRDGDCVKSSGDASSQRLIKPG